MLLWASVLHSLTVERRQALKGAEQDASNLTRAFEEHIVRSIKSVDQTLLYIRDSYSKGAAGFDMSAWTARTQALTDLTFQISIIDRDGILITSNFAPGGARIDLSDREHFRVQRDSERDDLFVSKPVLGRASHKWSIQMTRKILAPDGTFDGVIVVSIDPLYLSRFYDSVDVGTRGVVMLAGLDGVVRARAGATAAASGGETSDGGMAIGQSLGGGLLMTQHARRSSGLFVGREADGEDRIYAYREVRGYRLLVSVGLAESEVLATYHSSRRSYILFAALLSGLLLSVTALILVRQNRLNHARERLRDSEARYAQKSQLLEMTLEHMSQGIMMVDAGHRVQVCNNQAVEKLGLPKALMATHPDFADVLRWQWEHGEFGREGASLETDLRKFVVAGGVSDQPQTYERKRPNGRVLEVRSRPLPGGGVVRTYTDITERKRNEEVLRAARDEANRAARAKSEFLATMSHEIRSPMSGLLGVLELLRGTELDADQSRMAAMVQGSAASLLAVLNDILDFSKIDAGAIAIHPEPTRLRALAGELVEPHRLEAARKGVDVRLSFDDDVPDRVEVDPLRLRQILGNLLTNAVKFTHAGEIGLSVSVAAGAGEPTDARPVLRFAIRDSGIGMDRSVIGRLFEPFMQADGSTTRDFGGTGLGLCISRRFARLLDGELGVESEAGVGSTFTLVLPLIEATGPDPSGDAPSIAPPLAGSSRKGLALVADDDPTNRWLTQRQLQLIGLKVDVAENGEAALAALRERRYDLLVTDCHMPRMDGVALTRAVRADPDTLLQRLPIVGLTADVTEGQRARCREAGMNEVAIKPLTLERLSRLVHPYLGQAATGAKAPGPVTDEAAEPPARAPEPPVFDDLVYRELFEPEDPDGAAWLGEFLDIADLLVRTLAATLDAWDNPASPASAIARTREDIVATAHRFAGSALSAGATRAGMAARSLEQDAPDGSEELVRRRFATLGAELAAARAAIGGFLANLPSELIA